MIAPTYTEAEIKKAHSRAGGNLDKMMFFLAGEVPKDPKEWVRTIADLCQAGKVKETDFAIPEKGTPKEMADAYWRQLMLMEQVFNPEEWKADIANTDQRKYWVYANVIKDSSGPFGFRLSYDGCGCGYSVSCLGARPEFHDSATAIYVFKTFTAVYEGWMYYTYLSKQQKAI